MCEETLLFKVIVIINPKTEKVLKMGEYFMCKQTGIKSGTPPGICCCNCQRQGSVHYQKTGSLLGQTSPLSHSIISGSGAVSRAPVWAHRFVSSNRAVSSMPLIRRGSRVPEVKIVQQRLNRWLPRLGLSWKSLLVDGIFGPITEDAVRRFQKRVGLKIDGIVGPLTWKQLLAG